MLGYSRFIAKQLHSKGLIALHSHNQMGGTVSYDLSKYRRHGVLTAVTHRQPGVSGLHIPSTGFDGATSFNNIHSAGFANPNLLLNPGFETAGAMPPNWANWNDTIGDGAIDNEVVIVHEGTDAAKLTAGVLRNTYTNQSFVGVPDTRYRFRFWTRGDGVHDGRYAVYDSVNGAYIVPITATGVTGAAYAMVAVEFTAPAGSGSLNFYFRCPNTNTGITYFDACEVRRMDGFLGDQGAVIIPAQVANVGVWADGIARQIIQVGADGSNYLFIRKTVANNGIQFHYRAGGILEEQTIAGLDNIDFATYGMTWDIAAGAIGEVRYYIQGVPVGAVDVGLGTWVGDLLNTGVVLGASSTVPASVWSGNIGPAPFYNICKSPTEMAYLMTP